MYTVKILQFIPQHKLQSDPEFQAVFLHVTWMTAYVPVESTLASFCLQNQVYSEAIQHHWVLSRHLGFVTHVFYNYILLLYVQKHVPVPIFRTISISSYSIWNCNPQVGEKLLVQHLFHTLQEDEKPKVRVSPSPSLVSSTFKKVPSHRVLSPMLERQTWLQDGCSSSNIFSDFISLPTVSLPWGVRTLTPESGGDTNIQSIILPHKYKTKALLNMWVFQGQ